MVCLVVQIVGNLRMSAPWTSDIAAGRKYSKRTRPNIAKILNQWLRCLPVIESWLS